MFLSTLKRKSYERLLLGLMALALGGFLVSGCGGEDSTDDAPAMGTTSPSEKTGQSEKTASTDAVAIELFNSSGCAGCHTLSVADASGAVGPNLDLTSMTKAEIETQILNGGGPMPAYEGQLSDAEITSLADLISTSN